MFVGRFEITFDPPRSRVFLFYSGPFSFPRCFRRACTCIFFLVELDEYISPTIALPIPIITVSAKLACASSPPPSLSFSSWVFFLCFFLFLFFFPCLGAKVALSVVASCTSRGETPQKKRASGQRCRFRALCRRRRVPIRSRERERERKNV